MKLPDKLAEKWKGLLSANSSCTDYFEDYLLAAVNTPLVLGLDNVDIIFQYPAIACDFFPLLRAWHERATSNQIWQKLRLVIGYSRADYIPIAKNQSPFNVGINIEIPELDQAQIQKFAQHLKLNWQGEQIAKFMSMVGGHPWLVKEAMSKIARRELTLERFLQIASTQEGLYSDHLLRQWSILRDNSELLQAMRQVVAANNPVRIDPDRAYKLRNMRLVKYSGDLVQPLCDLYRLYFRTHLGVY